jgi:hypothetical protein
MSMFPRLEDESGFTCVLVHEPCIHARFLIKRPNGSTMYKIPMWKTSNQSWKADGYPSFTSSSTHILGLYVFFHFLLNQYTWSLKWTFPYRHRIPQADWIQGLEYIRENEEDGYQRMYMNYWISLIPHGVRFFTEASLYPHWSTHPSFKDRLHLFILVSAGLPRLRALKQTWLPNELWRVLWMFLAPKYAEEDEEYLIFT